MSLLRFYLALALILIPGAHAAAQKPDLAPLEGAFKKITDRARGRIGVALIHLESGATADVRGHERFPMASVVKLPIAIEVLTQVAQRRLSLDRHVWLAASDIRPCCSLDRHAKGGISRTVGQLLELTMIESDNTAADALLKLVGGPDVVERRMRALRLHDISVDRSEGQLLLDMAGVTNAPPSDEWTVELQRRLVADVDRESLNAARTRYLADERDTATPYATAELLARLKLGDLLPRAQTDLLIALMELTKTGMRRLKGRLPPDTAVAHKTGTTAVVINDAGIVTLPSDSKIPGRLAIAVYVADGSRIAAMERSVAAIAAAAFEFFTGKPIPAPQPAPRSRARR